MLYRLFQFLIIIIILFFFVISFLGKLGSVLRILPFRSFIKSHVFFVLFLNSNILLE